MSFDAILGQETAVEVLRRALAAGRVHHAYRFEGPEGVGKELAAFAFAETLVCGTDPGPATASARRRIHARSDEDPHVPLHPDVILVERGLYSKVLGAAETNGIGIEQIRRIVLARAGYPPHEGRAVVIIVRAADELTTQAANALLKTLEEPPPQTYFVLLTSRPQRLLDTVLSRTLPVRFGPLPDAVVERILEQHGASPAVAPLAQGSASLALELADTEATRVREDFIRRTLAALDAPSLAAAVGLGDTRTTDKHVLRDELGHLAQTFATEGRATVTTDPDAAERAARRHQAVLLAMRHLEQNVAPALALEAMVARLRRA
jgi:DNA polymerase III subunit delta'